LKKRKIGKEIMKKMMSQRMSNLTMKFNCIHRPILFANYETKLNPMTWWIEEKMGVLH